MKLTAITLALVMVLSSCAGSDSADGETAAQESGAGSNTAGDVVNKQPPGQAFVAVDGQEFTLTEPGGLDCAVSQDSVTFSFRIGDNEVTLGGGANLYDSGWLGSFDVRVANPSEGDGPVSYFPDLAVNGDGVAIDGDSMSYTGPMQKQPPNDGSNPPPVPAGDGTISLTC